MTWWWQREIAEARASADRAEQQVNPSSVWRAEAERVDERAKKLEDGLRMELNVNGFADALRMAFGGLQ